MNSLFNVIFVSTKLVFGKDTEVLTKCTPNTTFYFFIIAHFRNMHVLIFEIRSISDIFPHSQLLFRHVALHFSIGHMDICIMFADFYNFEYAQRKWIYDQLSLFFATSQVLCFYICFQFFDFANTLSQYKVN